MIINIEMEGESRRVAFGEVIKKIMKLIDINDPHLIFFTFTFKLFAIAVGIKGTRLCSFSDLTEKSSCRMF